MDYKPTIGLEIHAELKTKTKMFCSSRNDPDAKEPNINVCPVCMGHPGTLPVINKQAVRSVLMAGLALGAKLADYSEFDRKNYFYPDLPKGYQISQYEYPLVQGGALVGVDITRVHLEEDTARSQHTAGDQHSLVDFNRAGVPLMELVTEPVIHDALKASEFARELQLLLRYLGVSSANMEKGEMRVEANISVSNSDKLGTKVEVKNLNSIRAVKQAIEFEIERQSEMLDRGENIVQETRGWDEVKQRTFAQRLKEESHDYRYFPEPDLPKLIISKVPELSVDKLRQDTPELPSQKRSRYKEQYELNTDILETLINDLGLVAFFDKVMQAGKVDKKFAARVANYIAVDLNSLRSQAIPAGVDIAMMNPKDFADLIEMSLNGRLSSRGVKDILKVMAVQGGNPEKLVKEMNLEQVSDAEDLKTIVQGIINDQSTAVGDYHNGKESSLQFLVGQAMKATRGAANPKTLRDLFIELLTKP